MMQPKIHPVRKVMVAVTLQETNGCNKSWEGKGGRC